MAEMPDVNADIIQPLKEVLAQLHQAGHLKEDHSHRLQAVTAGRRQEDDTENDVLFRLITYYAGYAIQGIKQKDSSVQVGLPKPLQPAAGVDNCVKRWAKLQKSVEKLSQVTKGENHMADPAPAPANQNGNGNHNQPGQGQSSLQENLKKNEDWANANASKMRTLNEKELQELQDEAPKDFIGLMSPFWRALEHQARQHEKEIAKLKEAHQKEVNGLRDDLTAAQAEDETSGETNQPNEGQAKPSLAVQVRDWAIAGAMAAVGVFVVVSLVQVLMGNLNAENRGDQAAKANQQAAKTPREDTEEKAPKIYTPQMPEGYEEWKKKYAAED